MHYVGPKSARVSPLPTFIRIVYAVIYGISGAAAFLAVIASFGLIALLILGLI